MSRQGSCLIESEMWAIAASTDDPLVGATLGSYELGDRIGAGEYGVVYPANIVVGPNDRLTLLDFGTARAFGGTLVSETERVVGAPAYLAPETIRGTGGGVSADQYALGVLAYELLVGQRPFDGDDT